MTNHFRKHSKVGEDGMYVLGSLIPFMPETDQVLNSVWVYIEHALKMYQDTGLFKATLSCISSLAHKYR